MADGFSITVLGDVELQYLFNTLPNKLTTRALGSSLAKSATRIKKEGILPDIPVDTGRLKKAVKGLRARRTTRRDFVRAALGQPKEAREAIKLNVLEYGRGARLKGGRFIPQLPGKAIVRRATDRMAPREFPKIAADIRAFLDREALKTRLNKR